MISSLARLQDSVDSFLLRCNDLSMEALRLVQQRSSGDGRMLILAHIKELFWQNWIVEFDSIHREGNTLADTLAKLARLGFELYMVCRASFDDGSECSCSKYARAGGVIYDSSDAWIIGFGREIGITDIFTTELWAIYDDTNVRNGYPVLLTNILSLCQRSWVIEFLWVPHAANKVVDQLLKQNLLTHFDIIHLDDPSAYLQSFLDQDYNSPYGLAVA
ncbi:hypothetical protein V6N11_052836 [Hibiscus sabdariffa]|uniref:RNase H type-1 domain-containing protein n=1 Tax=Hibiscus sabdariffa TaxID=183260 RepID=A0ABR2UBH1_9ROSI